MKPFPLLSHLIHCISEQSEQSCQKCPRRPSFSSEPALLSLEEHQIMKMCSAYLRVQRGTLKAPGSDAQCELCIRDLLSADTKVMLFFSERIGNCENLTEKPCNFIGLLLLNFLIVQSFKEDVQHQYIFSVERTDKSKPSTYYIL